MNKLIELSKKAKDIINKHGQQYILRDRKTNAINTNVELTEEEILNLFSKHEDPDWISESDLAERSYQSQRDHENREKMKKVRACRKNFRY